MFNRRTVAASSSAARLHAVEMALATRRPCWASMSTRPTEVSAGRSPPPGTGAVPDAIGFHQGDTQARRGTGIRSGGTGQAPSDDDDGYFEPLRERRIGRLSRGAPDPGRDAVPCACHLVTRILRQEGGSRQGGGLVTDSCRRLPDRPAGAARATCCGPPRRRGTGTPLCLAPPRAARPSARRPSDIDRCLRTPARPYGTAPRRRAGLVAHARATARAPRGAPIMAATSA